MPKISRNALCPCGSGEKFKKCCIACYNYDQSGRDLGLQLMIDFKEQHPDEKVISVNNKKKGSLKMSAIIFKYAEDLLLKATTYEEKHDVIALVILVWNFSILDSDGKQERFNSLINAISKEKYLFLNDELSDLIRDLLKKKDENFSKINRPIADYQFNIDGCNCHLNVISIPTNDEVEEKYKAMG